jgi:hypothetical protein
VDRERAVIIEAAARVAAEKARAAAEAEAMRRIGEGEPVRSSQQQEAELSALGRKGLTHVSGSHSPTSALTVLKMVTRPRPASQAGPSTEPEIETWFVRSNGVVVEHTRQQMLQTSARREAMEAYRQQQSRPTQVTPRQRYDQPIMPARDLGLLTQGEQDIIRDLATAQREQRTRPSHLSDPVAPMLPPVQHVNQRRKTVQEKKLRETPREEAHRRTLPQFQQDYQRKNEEMWQRSKNQMQKREQQRQQQPRNKLKVQRDAEKQVTDPPPPTSSSSRRRAQHQEQSSGSPTLPLVPNSGTLRRSVRVTRPSERLGSQREAVDQERQEQQAVEQPNKLKHATTTPTPRSTGSMKLRNNPMPNIRDSEPKSAQEVSAIKEHFHRQHSSLRSQAAPQPPTPLSDSASPTLRPPPAVPPINTTSTRQAQPPASPTLLPPPTLRPPPTAAQQQRPANASSHASPTNSTRQAQPLTPVRSSLRLRHDTVRLGPPRSALTPPTRIRPRSRDRVNPTVTDDGNDGNPRSSKKRNADPEH